MEAGLDPLILDLVEWVSKETRLYSDVLDAWRTSCPRLTVWEDAVDRGYLACRPDSGGVRVTITPEGAKYLADHGHARQALRLP